MTPILGRRPFDRLLVHSEARAFLGRCDEITRAFLIDGLLLLKNREVEERPLLFPILTAGYRLVLLGEHQILVKLSLDETEAAVVEIVHRPGRGIDTP